ncbi:DUF1768-domain-containing protein [Daedalea quercina L-15889]|uniref:DUF1768-domain-containing protein n=1 Tax=Daedalea quercina L-15889 TaxID=1314783 RepID=A0A165LSD4_9APHY|nr:DUF1768-domain-containing protein [Daedalea quercina L-15889]
MRSYTRPPPSARSPEPTPAIRFYDRNQPYYEFTNFALYPIHWDGRMYPTAEHLFQAHKFMPNEPKVAEHIRELPSSRDALEEAGRLRWFQRADWFDVNIRVMDNILEAKFTQHFSLRDMLLGTGTQQLIEDSPVDSFWGCGQDGLGRNELGKALMRLRDKLSAQPASAGDEFVWRSPPTGQTAHSEEQYTLFGSTTAQKIPRDWTTVPVIDEGKQPSGRLFLRRGSASPQKDSSPYSRWSWR